MFKRALIFGFPGNNAHAQNSVTWSVRRAVSGYICDRCCERAQRVYITVNIRRVFDESTVLERQLV